MNRSDSEVDELITHMKTQQEELFKQAKDLNLTKESMDDVLYDFCKQISGILTSQRVSIWIFNEDQTELTEYITYITGTIGIPKIKKLTITNAQPYFDKIKSTRVNAVVDIEKDSVLQSLPSGYFQDTQMGSMLDASIIMSRGIGGMLCCESIGRREWTQLDEVICAAVADMLSFIFDRMNRIEMESRLFELAYTDPLTGIDNENAFIEKVNNRLHNFEDDISGAFLYIKLDQFAGIQSVFGLYGTQLIIKETAKRLSTSFPKDAIVARIAFDHFIIFTSQSERFEENRAVMERIMKIIREPISVSGLDVYMTFSYGVALYPDHITNAYEGIQAAKTALDSSQKKGSRKTKALYIPEMSEQWKEAIQSEMNLDSALELDQFCLYYQPQVESVSHRMTGVEALIRWKHPERGLLSPASFIEIAETTGLISRIGEWVLIQACIQLNEWEQLGLDYLTISVNISPIHFLQDQLIVFLKECLETYKINPEKLVIEITENVALEEFELVQAQMDITRELGFPISVDDFGTGYSAFIYLQHLSVQEVKIDRQFIKGVETDVKSRAIVRAILTLAKSLHMHTVAEGVETEGQLKRLEEMGCFEIQGYYFSKPIPVEKLNKLLIESPYFPKLYLPNPSDNTQKNHQRLC